MTVTEYSKKHGVSKQSVYDKLKRGTLQYKTIQGVKHIILNADIKESIKSIDNNIEIVSKKKHKRVLKKLNKSMQEIEILKEKIKGLKVLMISKDSEIDTLKKSLSAFSIFLEKKERKEIVHTVKPKKKKKK